MNALKYTFLCCVHTMLVFSFRTAYTQDIAIKNDKVSRTLHYSDSVWLTVSLSRTDGSDRLEMQSEEFHILGMDDHTLTAKDFLVEGAPVAEHRGDTNMLTIHYRRRHDRHYTNDDPAAVEVHYTALKGDEVIRKKIILQFDTSAVVDRLEVERFVTGAKEAGGGRGEPVFMNDKWFTGLEYPAGYSRHTDGNTPKAYSRHYEMVGNYSFINLQGRDMEPRGTSGMVRLMHFPGYAKEAADGKYYIESKTSVMGIGKPGDNAENGFMDYLATIWKAPRSFLHYNNWFEPRAKDLKGNALIDIYRAFKAAIAPYGIKMNAMVADDGWQDHESIWQPAPKYFPNGVADMKLLSEKLKLEGTGFGLWLSIGGTNAGVPWGEKHGYLPAKPNSYFARYFRYYSLSHPKYKEEMLRQVPRLAKEAGLVYFKHDFNQLSDLNDNAGHPPTDRHGHEANLDAMLEILLATRKVNPAIYQNITNWIWFSPWWLMYADALWMLAGDDGLNGNWPEISSRAMATTDRDTYIWRMWGDPADRPLVPISRLMTHGIIRTSTGRMESKDDTVQDWLEYVLMHYARGTLLKEWYISPEVMSPEHWKALCTVHNWAAANEKYLDHTVFVGGRPDEGNPYGYIGWNGNKAVLVVRNPGAATSTLRIPFDGSVQYQMQKTKYYHAKVIFPYRDEYPETFIPGQPMAIEIPGYATMAFEISEGKAGKPAAGNLPEIKDIVKTDSSITMSLPADAGARCDLLVIAYDSLPGLVVNGQQLTLSRTSRAAINAFAGYAIAGMPSKTARPWKMAAYDLSAMAGKNITISFDPAIPADTEIHLLVERKVIQKPSSAIPSNMPWAITPGTRRQTIQLR